MYKFWWQEHIARELYGYIWQRLFHRFKPCKCSSKCTCYFESNWQLTFFLLKTQNRIISMRGIQKEVFLKELCKSFWKWLRRSCCLVVNNLLIYTFGSHFHTKRFSNYGWIERSIIKAGKVNNQIMLSEILNCFRKVFVLFQYRLRKTKKKYRFRFFLIISSLLFSS